MRSTSRAAWMWEEALRTLEQAERLQQRFCLLLGAPATQPVWQPPVDVFETATDVWVTVALPGAVPESVNIAVSPSGLLISAERKLPAPLERMRIRRLEIPYGRFERRIDLPPGNYVLAESRLAEGCLELRLAKE